MADFLGASDPPDSRSPAGTPGASGTSGASGSSGTAGESGATETADAAEVFLRRHRRDRERRSLRARIELMNMGLHQWREFEANQRLAPAQRRPLRPPALPKETLEKLWAELVDELGRLDDAVS